MKKILKLKKIIILILAIITLISALGNYTQATTNSIIDESKKASLTITKYEHANGSTENKQLAGVEFTIYKIPNTIETVEDAEQYIKNNTVISYTKATPTSGTITFTNLDLGRYLVVETNSPKNVVTKVESCLIDLPRVTDDGKGWNYDVTIYPKNITIYGKATLNKSTETGEKLEGTIWNLQKQDENKKWVDYDYEVSLKTNENGQIILENLEVGTYRIYEIATLDGHILDSSNILQFTIDSKNMNYTLDAINEKPEINKYILLDDGTYGKNLGLFKTDTASWKITADVPSIITKMETFCIIDTLAKGLTIDEDSIQLYGINKANEEKELAVNTDYTITIKNKEIKIDFKTQSLKGMKEVLVTYNTNFSDDVLYGEFTNTAKLSYTDKISLDGEEEHIYTTNDTKDSEAKVYTGSVLIYKADNKGISLSNAQFKIATSKQNAKDGVFIKDKSGNDIIAISDENGYVVFNGLKYGNNNQSANEAETSYWIVEVQSPSYVEDGEIKYYNLSSKPVEVKVNYTSHIYSDTNTTVVINKKPFTLPFTGATITFLIPIILGILIILTSYILIKRKKSKKNKVIKVERKQF